MKILFTSVGRRVELLQAFRAAAEKLDIALTVMGADITKSAPALFSVMKGDLCAKYKKKNIFHSFFLSVKKKKWIV